MLNPEYIIQSIHPREGDLRDIHKRLLNKECQIIDLEIGHSARWMYYIDETRTWARTVYTSAVTDVDIHENGNLTIRTNNTMYELKKM